MKHYHPYFAKQFQDMLELWSLGNKRPSYEEIIEKISTQHPLAFHNSVTLNERCFFHKPTGKIPMKTYHRDHLDIPHKTEKAHDTKKKTSQGRTIHRFDDGEDSDDEF